MSNAQPEALQIIQHMDENWQEDWDGKRIRAELRRLHQSEREGWRYANEVEQDRKKLEAANQELLEALKYCRQKIAYMQANGEWYSPGRAIEMADAAIAAAKEKA